MSRVDAEPASRIFGGDGTRAHQVDDDTLFCGGAAGVAADLIALNTWDVDIRLTNYFEDRGLGADPATGTAATRDAIAACLRHRCGDACGATGVACLTCQTPCFDDQGAGPCPAVTAAPLERFHAQGGAVFRRRTPEAAEFFRDWARAYLAMWTRRRLRHRPPNATSGPFGDQGPLDALLAERCSYGSSDAWRLGRLPPNWNLRPTSRARRQR